MPEKNPAEPNLPFEVAKYRALTRAPTQSVHDDGSTESAAGTASGVADDDKPGRCRFVAGGALAGGALAGGVPARSALTGGAAADGTLAGGSVAGCAIAGGMVDEAGWALQKRSCITK
jgi:hypothetical protein